MNFIYMKAQSKYEYLTHLSALWCLTKLDISIQKIDGELCLLPRKDGISLAPIKVNIEGASATILSAGMEAAALRLIQEAGYKVYRQIN